MGTGKAKGIFICAAAGGGLLVSGWVALQGQETPHAECSMFGAKRDKFSVESRRRFVLGPLTEQVTRQLSSSYASLGKVKVNGASSDNLIDQHIFPALEEAGVTPAERTNDFEFIRRVTLDLTGRIPTPERLVSFTSDGDSGKRSKLVDELMSKPEWVDKWTVHFGDRFGITSRRATNGIQMFDDGRNAFYNFVKSSLAANKPYNQIAREIIAVRGESSYQVGPVNWYAANRAANGPAQDMWDAQTAAISETFLGLAHMDCLECHNGRGHLDQLNLWGKGTTRYQAWQLSSFLSKTQQQRVNFDPTNNNIYYWRMVENANAVNYPLNTTTGNRPSRLPVGTERNVAPVYFFNDVTPKAGENYRDVLAREVTADFQFARASVNYIWKEFFGRGIVEPANQFDLARLDPDNPPPDPWTLQPSNPRLLNALAQDFIDHNYDLKHLMSLIVNSEAYQLSSRYSGTWEPRFEPLFARKLVRRLWGEEIMDALVQTSGVPATYAIGGIGNVSWAMQSPEPNAVRSAFLPLFNPGNRDDEDRRGDGSPQQSLGLMNDGFVMQRTRASGSGATASLLQRLLPGTDDQLIENLYLNVLSRYPSDDEKTKARAALRTGNRTNAATDLLWSLYNKVDFVFNY